MPSNVAANIAAHIPCTHSLLGQCPVPSEATTRKIGECLARLVLPGDTLLFHGVMGVGKTALIRTLIRALPGVPKDCVIPSPTFTLAQSYPWKQGVAWHYDLYRLSSSSEVEDIGLYEFWGQDLCLVEWPERLGDKVPLESLMLFFQFADAKEETRSLQLFGRESWRKRIKACGLASLELASLEAESLEPKLAENAP